MTAGAELGAVSGVWVRAGRYAATDGRAVMDSLSRAGVSPAELTLAWRLLSRVADAQALGGAA